MIANKENWQPDCRGQICNSSICFVGVCLADVCLHFSYDLCEILTRCILFAHRSSPVGVPTSNCAFPSLKWETQKQTQLKNLKKNQSSRGEAKPVHLLDVDVIYQDWSCFYFIVNDVCLKFHHAQAHMTLMLFSVSAVSLYKETYVVNVMFYAFVWWPLFLIINLH